MATLEKLQKIALIALEKYPEISARYVSGDPTVTAHLNAMIHMLADMSRDVNISEIEPFIKSREATILADATNKGILPIATPCQHYVEVKNSGVNVITINSNRKFEDGQGRVWRFLQHADVPAGATVQVLAEQSEIRTVQHQITVPEPFYQYTLSLSDEMSLASLSVSDQDDNSYSFVTRWMNAKAGERAITLKTNTLREMTLEFGDTPRFGHTVEANTTLNIQVIETYGEIDVVSLKEAMLQQISTAQEGKIAIKFVVGGLVRMGADPLTIDQMRLLASYPTHDDNAVFLGNFDFLVRKNFMARTHFCSVWNEVVQEEYYGGDVANINHLFVAYKPKYENEYELLQDEIQQLITRADSLFKGKNTTFVPIEERPFYIEIKATLSPVHDVLAVGDQIKTLLLSTYGQGKIASSYHVANGFNLQEIIKLINKNVVAFQDRQSDFKVLTEDVSQNPIKPHQWLFVNEDSIRLDIQRSNGIGESLWAVL